jgi:hypothetical protein
MARFELCGAKGAGLFAEVDDDDLGRCEKHRWYPLVVKGSRTIYARTAIGGRTVYLHRFIMNAGQGEEIDHRDGAGLNCRRDNLRVVTHQMNILHGIARRAFDAHFPEG